jgi:hypothetical protein
VGPGTVWIDVGPGIVTISVTGMYSVVVVVRYEVTNVVVHEVIVSAGTASFSIPSSSQCVSTYE